MTPYIVASTSLGFSVVVVFVAVALVGALRVRKTLVYREALTLIRSSARLPEKIGSPVRVRGSWFAPGQVRNRGAVGYAHLRIPVEGPESRGTIYAVAHRIRGQWVFSDMVLAGEESKPWLSLLPPPVAAAEPFRGEGKIYLLPLGQPTTYSLDDLPEYFEKRFGIELKLLPVVPLDSSVVDASRKQLVAQKIIQSMKQAQQELSRDHHTILIGITEGDTYIAGDHRMHVFNLRKEGRFAVISTAQLGTKSLFAPFNPLVVQSRLRNLLIKNIGLLYYQLPLTSDPTSALYGAVDNGADLDWMTEDFIGAGGSENAFVNGGTCISIVQPFQGTPTWKFECGDLARSDVRVEGFLADMGTGLFVQRHTDFHFNEAFPTEIVRMYRPQDRQSRVFGIGTSHSFDIFLVGDAEHFSFIDLILEDGARIHYRRVSPGTGFAGAVFVSDDQFDNVFSGSRIQWNGHGWEILRQDGWTFVFPAAAGARRSQQAALTGIHDASGHAFRLDRNSQGDLLSLTTPEGTSVRFDYDSKARVVRAEDDHGRYLKYEYDDSGRLVHVQDSEGYGERYTYDEQDLMLSVSVNGRLVLINEYDSSGHLTGQTLSDGRKLAYRYTAIDGKPKGTVLIDPRGYLTRLRYGPGGEVVRLMPEVPGSQ